MQMWSCGNWSCYITASGSRTVWLASLSQDCAKFVWDVLRLPLLLRRYQKARNQLRVWYLSAPLFFTLLLCVFLIRVKNLRCVHQHFLSRCWKQQPILAAQLRVDDGSHNVSRWMTWLPISLKNAAKCDKWYQLQNLSITESLNANGARKKLHWGQLRACHSQCRTKTKIQQADSVLGSFLHSLVEEKTVGAVALSVLATRERDKRANLSFQSLVLVCRIKSLIAFFSCRLLSWERSLQRFEYESKMKTKKATVLNRTVCVFIFSSSHSWRENKNKLLVHWPEAGRTTRRT
jgi:hypothetical protein